jgi:hypothetical protein
MFRKPRSSTINKTANTKKKLTNIEQQIRTLRASLPKNHKNTKPSKQDDMGTIGTNSAYSNNINIYTKALNIRNTPFHLPLKSKSKAKITNNEQCILPLPY